MAKTKPDTSAYDALRADLDAGNPGNLYFFYGEEHYLMNSFLTRLRSTLVPEGTADFNHRRFEGKGLTVSSISDAVDAMPAFSERTLVEIHDFDVFKCAESERGELIALFNELPEYVCLVFVYDTIAFSPDRRLKDTKELLKNASAVEFALQDQTKLVKWIRVHFREGGKSIDAPTAEYLSFLTGGLMSTLSNEILKICAYAQGDTVTRDDIDAVVTPVLDAVAFKLANALADGKYQEAVRILDELLRMREPAHKIFFNISLTMRQLLAARLCIENGCSTADLIEMCSIRHEFQARNLMANAKKLSLDRCRNAVLLCADAALSMNSGGKPENILTELVSALGHGKKVSAV